MKQKKLEISDDPVIRGALRIDFAEVSACGDCSEQWGFCGYHQEKFGVDFKGEVKK